jgi:hypothetical protein
MSGSAGDWLAVHRAVFDHPKTKRLAKRLGIDVSAAAGYLICLWTWAMTVAPEGDLTRYDPEEIEAAAGWGGAEGRFFDNVVFCHWIDGDKTIHDWKDWRGALVDKRARDAERKRTERASASRPQDVQRMSAVCPVDVPVKTDRTDKRKSIGDEKTSPWGDDYEKWWILYGRVGNKALARECYYFWRKADFPADRLLAAIPPYLADCIRNDRSVQHAATFLKKRVNCWEEWITEEHGSAKPSGNGNGKPKEVPPPGKRWQAMWDIDKQGPDKNVWRLVDA